ncbi:MAG: hypothetical protein MMC33_010547 [Icmadophila ericetorum]|nr:hypothetical protein [Icmadophila ericetorum]
MHRFLNDLTKIRDNTFKKDTIRHAFRKSGMWPIDASQCISQLKIFNPDLKKKKREAEDDLPLPEMPRTNPSDPTQVIDGLKEWLPKIQRTTEWSDPIRPYELEQYASHLESVCTEASLSQAELRIYQKQRQEQMSHNTSRKRLRKGVTGKGLTLEDAHRMMEEKAKKENEDADKRVRNNWLKGWRDERDLSQAKGKVAKEMEKNRLKLVKEYEKCNETIPDELLVSVPDPWDIWTATDPEWLARQAARKQKARTNLEEQPDDVTFIIDTTGDSELSLQQDKIVFDDDSDTGSRFGFGLEPESDSDSEDDVQAYLNYY